MARSRRLFAAVMGLILSIGLTNSTSMTVEAGSNVNYLDSLSGGVAAMLSYRNENAEKLINTTEKELSQNASEDAEETTLVMANVKKALNVRAQASEDAEKVGKLYKDCGGRIIERKDGWTKLQSGNLIGWAKDEFLLFDEEAEALADSVGKMIAVVDAEALNVRKESSETAGIHTVLAKGEILDVVSVDENGWVCVEYEGQDGFVLSEFVDLEFKIDNGETMEEIKAREEAEKEAKRYKNYGAYTTDADTTLLLAALIHCEAGGEPYEGQVAVGAVVMNRVRSSAYPDTIHGVIYASGQFTPAMSGKVNRVLESGKIYPSCIQAAEEALSGVSNVGDLTHFRRNDGRDGIVIGNHVFH
ncbi:MAG: cell wall hydrolase [Lachnospiraceae bacterium]|nr:cell wall hydrolase [Lachnospiraceae bacterium]